MIEFNLLFSQLSQSGCAKKQTACGVYVNGEFISATNHCIFDGDVCPRLHVESGTHYELCKSIHAEANLAAILIAQNKTSDGIAWLVGHYWICEPCAAALKKIGVREIRIMEIAK